MDPGPDAFPGSTTQPPHPLLLPWMQLPRLSKPPYWPTLLAHGSSKEEKEEVKTKQNKKKL